MRSAFALVISASLLASACSASPPIHWAEGGSPVVLSRARWDRPDGPIDVLDDGRVLVGGSHVWTIDRVGRVVDEENSPIALLLPDGNLAGPDHKALGYIGQSNTSPPGESWAWVSIAPGGQVIRFDADGNRYAGGIWSGCEGPQIRVCALVTHLVALREQTSRSGVSVGVGFGMTVIR
ncbi:MAG: hypothetical protein U0165_13505 [Polyangiaceae bacterium]